MIIEFLCEKLKTCEMTLKQAKWRYLILLKKWTRDCIAA